jgi:hypothetical protein
MYEGTLRIARNSSIDLFSSSSVTSASHISRLGTMRRRYSFWALWTARLLWARRIGRVVRVSDSISAFTLVNFSLAAGWFERVRWPSDVIGGRRCLQIDLHVYSWMW